MTYNANLTRLVCLVGKTPKTNNGFDAKPAIAKALLDLRTAKHLTQVDVANIISVTPSTYARWEQQVNTPDTTALFMLAAAYDVSLDAFGAKDALQEAKRALKKR